MNALTAASPLDGLLVSLDLQGIVLRRDGELLRAKPPHGVALDAETRQGVAEHKAALLAWVDMPDVQRRGLLLLDYERTLTALGREVQRLYREQGRQHPDAVAMETGWRRALERLEVLYQEDEWQQS